MRLLIALAGAILVLLAACGGGSTSSSTPTATPTPSPAPVACTASNLYGALVGTEEAQGAKFLSFGIGSILISWCGNWQQARWPIWSTATFAALVLLASILHRGLFAVASTSAIVWFGGFTLALLGLAAAAGQMRSIDRRQIGAVAT